MAVENFPGGFPIVLILGKPIQRFVSVNNTIYILSFYILSLDESPKIIYKFNLFKNSNILFLKPFTKI